MSLLILGLGGNNLFFVFESGLLCIQECRSHGAGTQGPKVKPNPAWMAKDFQLGKCSKEASDQALKCIDILYLIFMSQKKKCHMYEKDSQIYYFLFFPYSVISSFPKYYNVWGRDKQMWGTNYIYRERVETENFCVWY